MTDNRTLVARTETDEFGLRWVMLPILDFDDEELVTIAHGNRAEEIKAALGAGWRPISEAPKDGTLVLMCVAGFEPACGRWYEDRQAFDHLSAEDFPSEESWNEYIDLATKWPVTHFMPLPAPPSSTEAV